MHITLQGVKNKKYKELTMTSNKAVLVYTLLVLLHQGTNRLQLSCNHFTIGYLTVKQLYGSNIAI